MGRWRWVGARACLGVLERCAGGGERAARERCAVFIARPSHLSESLVRVIFPSHARAGILMAVGALESSGVLKQLAAGVRPRCEACRSNVRVMLHPSHIGI